MPSEREKQLREQVIEKAWADSAFRLHLLTDPKAAILKEFGIDIPAEFNLKVLEETDDTLYLVLPKKPDDKDSLTSQVCVPRWL
ncbi:NHLP leader peptide family RiPP precursor [Paenibacillus sp. NPDC057967]|uniref:NHLP leader peptide family RiPP precursor n=1 Tax=Paenibacillus sp. NPDC057967 TaxID=3346293 RepID=UPI0036DB8707